MIDFINIFFCNYSGFLSKCHVVTRYSRIWWKGGGGCVWIVINKSEALVRGTKWDDFWRRGEGNQSQILIAFPAGPSMIRLGLYCFPTILSSISMYMSNAEAIWYEACMFISVCGSWSCVYVTSETLWCTYFTKLIKQNISCFCGDFLAQCLAECQTQLYVPIFCCNLISRRAEGPGRGEI